MKQAEAQEIIECLPRGKTKYFYFKDKYALDLLSLWVGDGRRIPEIRRGPFSSLLARPVFKDVLSGRGDGRLSASDLLPLWPDHRECYLLTLGTWGRDRDRWRGFYQTSRSGVNLVLQLNFSSTHNRAFDKLIGDDSGFEYRAHPIAQKPYRTLAWARLDIDLEAREALIEEIQTDWIRLAMMRRTTVEALETTDEGRRRVRQRSYGGVSVSSQALASYVENVLGPHIRLWDEAILSASIWFLRHELGLRHIYYHDWAFGNRLKGISGTRPPRSLYTSLPKRFCFRLSGRGPGFLDRILHQRRLEDDARFHSLSFG